MPVEEEPHTEFGDCEDPTETILDREMPSSPTQVLACFFYGHVMHAEYIELETEPSTPSTDLSSTTGTSSNQTRENSSYTHVYRCGYEASSHKPVIEKFPLPDMRPKCPKGWSAAAWESRHVGGNSRYHIFVPFGSHFEESCNPPFVLQVSDKFRNGDWVYEDIGPLHYEDKSPSSTRRLEDEMAKFKVETLNSFVEMLDAQDYRAEVARAENPKATPDERRGHERKVVDIWALRDIRDCCRFFSQSLECHDG